MNRLTLTAGISMIAALATANALTWDGRSEARIDIARGGVVNIVANSGSVNVHSGAGRQVVVVSVTHSAKIEVDQNATPDKKRVEIRTHVLSSEKVSDEDARVEYDVTVPGGVSVSVSTATAPITVNGLSDDVSLSSDTGQITVRNVARAHVHIRGVAAPVSLSDINNGHVEITSTGGTVQIVNVTGPLVEISTTSGSISYHGDCSGGGRYIFTTHSGAIDVTLPETASVDLSARSVNGLVQNDFPLRSKNHSAFVTKAGSSFTGTSLSGSSSVELQSFSGKIRVKKQ